MVACSELQKVGILAGAARRMIGWQGAVQYKWESEFASARRLRESARQCRHVVPAPSVDGREAPHSGSVGRRLWAHFGQGGGGVTVVSGALPWGFGDCCHPLPAPPLLRVCVVFVLGIRKARRHAEVPFSGLG